MSFNILICELMFRFPRVINLFNRKDGFITKLKNKLLKDNEELK